MAKIYGGSEKKARQLAQKAEEAARELARPKPLLSELFGEVGRVEMYGRSEDGERFIAELGPPTRITAQTLPKWPNPFREVLWETRTWDNWSLQLVHYTDTGKVYLFLGHGPHHTARLLVASDARHMLNALWKAVRRLEKARKPDVALEKAEDKPQTYGEG
ncbi:MAG: hypothetical protein QXL54_04060 [Candidatus Bathyarchaeia archaeon]